MAVHSHSSHEVKTLLSWHAPGRPFKKHAREFFMNATLIALAVSIILFLFSQYLLIAVVMTLTFFSFTFFSVPPHDFYYKISSEGIMVEDHFFLWQELYDFYFKVVDHEHVLHVRTKNFLPAELVIVLGDMSVEHVKSVLLPYLPYREYIRPTFTEKSGDWLSRTFPLDVKPTHHK